MSNSARLVMYLGHVIGPLLPVTLLELFLPHVIPFSFLEFWYFDGSFLSLIKDSWMILAWGVILNLFVFIFSRPLLHEVRRSGEFLSENVVSNFMAGFFEEISFRWLYFYTAIVGVKIVNWIWLGGWTSYEPVKWIYSWLTRIANFFTLDIVEYQLLGGLGWAVGAAIISCNGKFRDGHAYQGLIGLINSWFMGIFLFFIMFQYGLIGAMVVHFLFNFFVTILRYLDLKIEGIRNPELSYQIVQQPHYQDRNRKMR